MMAQNFSKAINSVEGADLHEVPEVIRYVEQELVHYGINTHADYASIRDRLLEASENGRMGDAMLALILWEGYITGFCDGHGIDFDKIAGKPKEETGS